MESTGTPTVTRYQEATAYAVMKWPSPATHSRARLADVLATVAPALTRLMHATGLIRASCAVLYQHASAIPPRWGARQ
jgi:hypothetical protein